MKKNRRFRNRAYALFLVLCGFGAYAVAKDGNALIFLLLISICIIIGGEDDEK